MVGRGVTRQEWVSTGALRHPPDTGHTPADQALKLSAPGETLQTLRAGPSRSCPAPCVCPCPRHLAGLGSLPLLLLRVLQACPGAAALWPVLLSSRAEFPLALGLARRSECCPPWVPTGPAGPLLSVSLEPAGVAAVAFALRVGQFPQRFSLPAAPDALRSWPREGGVPPPLATGASSRPPGTCVRGERSGEQGQAEQLRPRWTVLALPARRTRWPSGEGGAPGGAVLGPLPSSGARGRDACRQPNWRPGAFIRVTAGAPVGH